MVIPLKYELGFKRWDIRETNKYSFNLICAKEE